MITSPERVSAVKAMPVIQLFWISPARVRIQSLNQHIYYIILSILRETSLANGCIRWYCWCLSLKSDVQPRLMLFVGWYPHTGFTSQYFHALRDMLRSTSSSPYKPHMEQLQWTRMEQFVMWLYAVRYAIGLPTRSHKSSALFSILAIM